MRLRRARLRSGSEEGAAAVEFALVVPLLLLILFAIIEFGAAYNAQIIVTNAAREAARAVNVAEAGVSADDRSTRGTAAARASLSAIGVEIDELAYSEALDCTAPDVQHVTLTVEKRLLTNLFDTPFTLTGQATRLCAG